MHLATIWIASIGTTLSAYFILAANSFMQHPVGYIYNETTGRAELVDFAKVLTQNTAVTAFFHTMASGFLVSGALVAGVSAYLIIKGKSSEVLRPTLKLGVVTTLIASVLVFISGDMQSRVMVAQQPMKMAAAEALYETTDDAPFSIFTIGSLDGSREVTSIKIPSLLSILSTGSADGTVEGINDLQTQYEEMYGPGNYKPNIPAAYWSFRLMIGFGALGGVFALWALWAMRGKREPKSKWFLRAAILTPFLPLIGIAFGWIFTETARQPWIVFGLMQTSAGVSPTVTVAQVATSLVVFSLLYGVLAVIEFGLLTKAIKLGPPETVHHNLDASASDDRPLTFAY
jgi:cytochrome d ubiquinol oxidase subunit I